MMDWEDARVQLIDTPPITADYLEGYLSSIIRASDGCVLVVDLGDDDGPFAAEAVLEKLGHVKTVLVGEPPATLTITLRPGASIALGVCYGLLPLVPAQPGWVNPLLFIAGAGQAFFLPLLGALALGLVGHAALNRTMGQNQGWNHAGNLAAALLAMGLVSVFGLSSVFFAVTVVFFVSSTRS